MDPPERALALPALAVLGVDEACDPAAVRLGEVPGDHLVSANTDAHARARRHRDATNVLDYRRIRCLKWPGSPHVENRRHATCTPQDRRGAMGLCGARPPPPGRAAGPGPSPRPGGGGGPGR